MTADSRLYVYYLPNLDGINAALVAAPNQVRACRLMGATVGGFRRYGGRRLPAGDARAAAARSLPGRVWRQKIGPGGPPRPWLLLFEEATPR